MSRRGQRPVCGRAGCGWRATRPSGLCGTHDNQEAREQARAEGWARRERDRARALAQHGAAARALWRAGVPCEPSLAGVLLSGVEAERLAGLLSRRGASHGR